MTSCSCKAPAKTHPKGCACPSCVELNIFCRPRFFPGQLLTETDLNRLENYVVKKNRLHNRYLHDPGVVCGLQVVCDPCGPGVLVKPGYAINSCGDDIVLPDETPVDVCSLINQCKSAERSPCDPVSAKRNGANRKSKPEELWVLSICYKEFETAGTALFKNYPPSDRCGSSGCDDACKGDDTCICGCQDSQSFQRRNYQDRIHSKQTQHGCEPTQICEGVCFKVSQYKRDLIVGDQEQRFSLGAAGDTALGQQLEACLLGYYDLLLAIVGLFKDDIGTAEKAERVCIIKENLLDHVRSHNFAQCELLSLLDEVQCDVIPDDDEAAQALILRTTIILFVVWLEGLKGCICSALFPPCPEDGDACVPLALVTVANEKEGCKVIEVCNWVRDFSISIPSLKYWAEFLFVLLLQLLQGGFSKDTYGRFAAPRKSFKEILGKICCTPLFKRFFRRSQLQREIGVSGVVERAAVTDEAAAARRAADVSESPGAQLGAEYREAEALLKSVILNKKDDSTADVAREGFAELIGRLYLKPLAGEVRPHRGAALDITGLAGITGKSGFRQENEMDSVKEQLAALQAKVLQQEREIEGLKNQ